MFFVRVTETPSMLKQVFLRFTTCASCWKCVLAFAGGSFTVPQKWHVLYFVHVQFISCPWGVRVRMILYSLHLRYVFASLRFVLFFAFCFGVRTVYFFGGLAFQFWTLQWMMQCSCRSLLRLVTDESWGPKLYCFTDKGPKEPHAVAVCYSSGAGNKQVKEQTGKDLFGVTRWHV